MEEIKRIAVTLKYLVIEYGEEELINAIFELYPDAFKAKAEEEFREDWERNAIDNIDISDLRDDGKDDEP